MVNSISDTRVTYTEGDVRWIATPAGFAAGSLYASQGRVLSVAWDDDAHITARVVGNERRPYVQSITFGRGSQGALISGSCTCPVGLNCKHVVAALLKELGQPQAARPSPEDGRGERIERRTGASPAVAPSPQAEGLPRDLAVWLDDLDRARATAEDTYPPGLHQRLIYLLRPVDRRTKSAALGVCPVSTRLLKSGLFSEQNHPYGLDRVGTGVEAKFLRPVDIKILGDLARLKRDYYTTDSPLYRDAGGLILTEMLSTGRVRWLTVNGPALAPGEPRQGRVEWRLSGQAEMRPVIEAGDGLKVLNAIPPVYVDPEAGLVGPIDIGLAPKVASALLDAPAVPAAHVAGLSQAMARRAPDLAHLRPAAPAPPRIVSGAPVPVLRLFAAMLPSLDSPGGRYRDEYSYGDRQEETGLARLSFRYGPIDVALSEKQQTLTRLHGEDLIEVHRDVEAERRHLGRVLGLGFVAVGEVNRWAPAALARDFLPEGDALAWFDMLYHDLPELAAQGWEIEVAPEFPFKLLRGEGSVDAEIREGSGIDWFELGLGILVDGERIDLVGPVAALISGSGFNADALRAGRSPDEVEPFYLPLGDGRFLAMSPSRLEPIVALVQDLFSRPLSANGRLRLGRVDAPGLADFEAAAGGADIVWHGGERLRDMGRQLGASSGIPAAVPPPTFRAALRPYQSHGVAWMAFLRQVGFGGVLADDMGLGKTVQALALVAIEKAEGRLDRPALVVAPTSLMANWHREAERFAPDLRVLTLHGLDRKTRFAEIPASDLVLTTYPLIARDHAVLSQTCWHLLILDEAQTIKNPDASTTGLFLGVEARHRFCLSGTPLENHLGELWSLFSFAVPGLLGDRRSFARHWRTPIEKQGDTARAQVLARRIKPFLLRRTKEQVASELPPKTEIVERIEFQAAQREIYESIRLTMHKRVRDAVAAKGFARSRIVILDALLKLRQVCCDPRLLKLNASTAGKAGSAKLERLDDMLAELHAEQRRILVFSQFTSMLDLIRPRLDARNISYALVTGDTRDRDTEIRRFQDGATPVFLVSLKAGGHGPQPDGRRHGDPLRSLVEPGRRGSGDRSCPSDRPEQAGLRP